MPRSKKPRVKASTSSAAAAHKLNLFIDALIANGENATQAAIAAGYSAKSATSRGSQLLTNLKVQQALEARRKQVADKFQLTAENVARSCAQALFFDPRKLYDAAGNIRPIHDLDDDTVAALASMEETRRQERGGDGDSGATLITQRVKWGDKNAAREQAMKYLGLYEKDNKQKSDPITQLLEAINGKTAKLSVAKKPVG